MTPDIHRLKAERIERSMAKLDPRDDHEAIIDGCMVAAGHWINYTLHTLGITAPDHDVVHAYFVTLFERQYWAIAAGPELVDSLEEIETLRPQHVRGDAPGGARAARLCLKAVERLRKKAAKAKAGKRPGKWATPVFRM